MRRRLLTILSILPLIALTAALAASSNNSNAVATLSLTISGTGTGSVNSVPSGPIACTWLARINSASAASRQKWAPTFSPSTNKTSTVRGARSWRTSFQSNDISSNSSLSNSSFPSCMALMRPLSHSPDLS